LIAAGNTTTSINLPQIVELYGNFGLIGVIAGMFIFGLIYRALLEIYIHPGMGLGALVGGVYVSSKLIDIGSASSLTFGVIPWSMVLIGLINLIVQLAEIDARSLGSRAPVSARARAI
jgi:hypothetical protein